MEDTPLFIAQQSFQFKIIDGFLALWRGVWKILLVLILSLFVRLDWSYILSMWVIQGFICHSFKSTAIFLPDGIYEDTTSWILLGRRCRGQLSRWSQINDWQVTTIGRRPLLLINTTRGTLRVAPPGTPEQAYGLIEEAVHILTEQRRRNIL